MSLEVGSPFPEFFFNYVAPALRAAGTAVVLKLSFPGDPSFERQAEALGLDRDRGAMLLERLEPG